MKAAYKLYQHNIRETYLQNQVLQASNGNTQEQVVLSQAEQSLVNLFNSGQGHSLVANYANR